MRLGKLFIYNCHSIGKFLSLSFDLLGLPSLSAWHREQEKIQHSTTILHSFPFNCWLIYHSRGQILVILVIHILQLGESLQPSQSLKSCINSSRLLVLVCNLCLDIHLFGKSIDDTFPSLSCSKPESVKRCLPQWQVFPPENPIWCQPASSGSSGLSRNQMVVQCCRSEDFCNLHFVPTVESPLDLGEFRVQRMPSCQTFRISNKKKKITSPHHRPVRLFFLSRETLKSGMQIADYAFACSCTQGVKKIRGCVPLTDK